MRRSVLLMSLLFVALTAFSQTEKPKKEFILSLAENNLHLKPGESKDVSIAIVRSNAFSKSKAKLGLSSPLPAGVTIVFEPSEGSIESTVAKITVAPNATPGNFTILPSCVINNKSKSTTLRLTIAGNSSTASGN